MASTLRGILNATRLLSSNVHLDVALSRQSSRLLMQNMKPIMLARSWSSGLSLDQQFSEFQKKVTTLSSEPDNDTKLKLYALFKQATVGKCNAKKPGALDFVGKAKWQAWDSLQDMTQDSAKQQYVALVNSLLSAEGASSSPAAPQQQGTGEFNIPGLLVQRKPGYLQVTWNRPEKRNAITSEMYVGVQEVLEKASKDDSVSFVAFRGAGDYYCSGNDLGNFAKYMKMNMSMPEMAKAAGTLLKDYVSSYVEFQKPIVGVINGPAVGIAVTVLGLFDVIYSTDRATFHTPFSSLGQAPEGCSTYTFPKLMGYARANQILMLNKKITAAEAKDLGLLSEVFPDAVFEQEVEKRLTEMAALPKLSLQAAKRGTRSAEIDVLRKVNALECELIQEAWLSEDCQKAIVAFFTKSKM